MHLVNRKNWICRKRNKKTIAVPNRYVWIIHLCMDLLLLVYNNLLYKQ